MSLLSVEWRPAEDRVSELRLVYNRGDATVLGTFEDGPLEETRDRFRSFVENVTDLDRRSVEEETDRFFEAQAWQAVRSTPEGEMVNVTRYEMPFNGPWATDTLFEDVDPRPVAREQAAGEERSFEAEPWGFRTGVAVAEISQTVNATNVSVKVDALDTVTVLVRGDDDAETPGRAVNATFDRLGLGSPDPDDWRFHRSCVVHVEEP